MREMLAKPVPVKEAKLAVRTIDVTCATAVLEHENLCVNACVPADLANARVCHELGDPCSKRKSMLEVS